MTTGFSEARASHFVSPEALERAGGGVDHAVRIRNPLGADQALLRPVLLAGLLDAVARNLRHGATGVRLFELGMVFRDDERTALGLVSTGEGADFYDMKGVLQSALGAVEFQAESGLALRIGGAGVEGALRRLPRALADACDARGPVFYAEVLVDGWLEAAPGIVRVQTPPKFPAIHRDVSLILPRDTPYAAVEKVLVGARVPHLRGVSFKDVFEDPTGEKRPVDRRSITVTLTFREDGRTLTSDEADRAVEALRDHAKAELGAAFRV